MAQNVLLSAYPPPYVLLNSPNQQQKGNYFGYSQLVPSFQAANFGTNSFASSFQPSYVIPDNYTKGLNVSASESIPTSGSYPAFQNTYFPSFGTLPSSWPSLTLPALQQASSNSAGGFPATPAYQPAANTGSFNTLTPATFGSIFQGQHGTNAQFPAFPLTSYSQDYAQLGLPKYTHVPYGTNRGNIQSAKKPAQANEHNTLHREPSEKGRNQYSSKYSNPGSDFKDGSYTRKNPQELDDSYDSEESSKSSDTYKNSDTSHKPNHEDDDDDGDYKNSYDFAEHKKRPQFTAPSDDDDDDDESEKSSSFSSRSCNSFNSSPSKAASSHSNSFSDDHHDFSAANFEDQFKAFPFNENFKVPDFKTESSKKVSDYYMNPASSNEKHLRMLYTKQSKVTDSYMTPTEKRQTEIPKTLHYYNYKPPEYTFGGYVEYFPNSPFKPSPEQTRPHTTQQPPNDREEETEGDESMTTVVTHKNKMHR
ncbi:hypothetical protein B7P43_G13601 [Cryptotermes secundus]|nr:hypothetical protein B7P43_G13601 [Cryptotermes secundus]